MTSSKNSGIKKFLSILLTVALCVQIVPIMVFAQSRSETETESTVSATSDSIAEAEAPTPEILAEEVSLREENVKHFRMSDGSIQAAQYAVPVHFQKNGVWTDYDNTLTEVEADAEENEGKLLKNKDLTNQTADYSVRLSKKTNGHKFVRLEKDGYKLSWYYLDAKKSTAKVAEAEDDGDPTTLEKLSTTVLYENVFKATDFEYVLNSQGVKENLLLQSTKAPTEFTAEYKANGLTPVAVDTQTIELRASDGRVVYVLTAPYMEDANGETSVAVTLTLGERKNDTFQVVLALDSAWLQADERAFPVTVDPYLQTSQEWNDTVNCHSTFIASGTPGTCYGRGSANYEGSIYVGKTNGLGKTCGLIKTPNLPTLGIADKVIHAELSVFVTACYPELRIDLHRVTTNWNQSTVCWNSGVGFDGAILDYQIVQTMERSDTNADRWQRFEITDLVRGWYSGEVPNYGVFLRSDAETSSSQARAWILSSGYTTVSGVRPVLVVYYRNMSGYEDQWSFTNLSAGRNGVVSVNNFNGNLVYSQPVTASASGNKMPVDLSLVFNSNKSDAPYSRAGSRMQTNFQIYLSAETGQLAENGFKYYMNDADGTKHWFYFENGSTTEGKDEDGLGLTLKVIAVGSDTNDTSAKYVITDKNEVKMYFNASGRLTKILNPDGNSATVSYEQAYGVTRISSIQDGAGRSYTFRYLSADYPSHIEYIVDPAGRETRLTYYLGTVVGITFPDGKSVSASYNYNDYSLTEIRGIDGTRVKISYDNSQQKRVSQINWGTSDSSLLENYTFTYKQNATTVTDKITNRSYTYQFNDAGQQTGIVSNQDGSAQFYNWAQPASPTDSRANKLIQESQVLQTVTNYVVNPGFTRTFSDGYVVYIEDSANQSISIDSTRKNITKSALKIYKAASNTGRVNAVQYMNNLAAGTYTFSAYINTEGATIPGGVSMFVEIWNSSNVCLSGIPIEQTNSTDGWERRSVTFTLPQGCTARLVFGLGADASGTVWFDDLQLEKGEGESAYNLVENSGFTNGMTGWRAEGGAEGSRTDAGLTGFDYCGKLPGTVEGRYKSLLQTINVSGQTNDVFTFGMWVYAASAPVENGTKDGDAYEPRFEFVLHYYDAGGRWRGYVHINCNPDLKNEWQFVTGEAIIPRDYDKIAISLIYDHNVNNAYITGAFCFKEQYGQTYDYDSNGNVVSTKDLAETNSKFSYYGSQMSAMLNPSGSSYLYTYNNKKQLTYALSSDGLQYGFTYDGNGNVTKAEVTARQPATTLESGKEYYLINAYSGLALDSYFAGNVGDKSTTYRYTPGSAEQKWRLETVSGEPGVYNLKSMVKPEKNLYFDVTNASSANGAALQIYTKNGTAAQKFKIVSERDNTFSLFTGSSGYTLLVDGQKHGNYVEQSKGVFQTTPFPNASEPCYGQRWYFYPVETTEDKTIVTETTYTQSGNFAASSKDERGNETTYAYNEQKGTLNSTTDALGRTTSYTYDANNNALLSVSAGGMTNSYAYSDDRLQTITVNSSLQYAFAYDVFGRTTSTKVGNGTSWRTLSSLSYNSAGLMSKQTYGNGDYIDFTYDSLDRITEKKYNGSSTRRATYAYGADGSLARSTDFSTGTTTKYVYDLADRLVGVREYTGTSISARALRASTDYIYADKTNYLIGMRHFSPLGTQTVDYTYGDITKGQMPDQVYSVKWNGEEKLSYTYDPLGRLSTRTLHVTGNVESIPQLTTQYSYVNVGEDLTTTMVQSVSTMGVTHNYTYDAVGNIQSIQLGSDVTSYEYDALNQLVRVNDPIQNRTVTYEYENGNITFEHTYDYTTGELPDTPEQSTQYHYNDPVWRDVLTGISYLRYTSDGTANAASAYSADAAANTDAGSVLAESLLGEDFHAVEPTGNSLFAGTLSASAFGAQMASAQASNSAVAQSTSTIQSDEIGNITNIDGIEFFWDGRQLQGAGENGTPYIRYEYNIDGQRTKKILQYPGTDTPTVTEYFYNGSTLAGQKTGNDVLVFMYDESGDIFGFTYNGDAYYYLKNAQNDVFAVTNADGQAVVLYFYDAWGNVTRSYEADGYEAIAQINPILYRSYYFDAEFGFYYLNTRYYVPAIHRFLNSDSVIAGVGESVSGNNPFTYCFNNPVNYSDENGNWPKWVETAANWVKSKIIDPVKNVINKTLSVQHDVPLYNQGNLPLCWAYSQTMVESYQNGTTLTQEGADRRAREIAVSVYGEDNWRQAGWPTNTGKRISSVNRISLAYELKKGPLYGYYANDKDAHLIVVTGIDVLSGTVFTNNPWGVSGQQSIEEFKNGFAGAPDDQNMPLICLYRVD